MKIVVTGASGLLGHEVVRICTTYDDEVIQTDVMPEMRCLDITDMDSITGVLETERPHWLINCAAYANVDGCEEHEDTAFTLNTHGPEKLACACERYGTKLLHISSDYVFDGEKTGPYTEEDTANPISVYGRSKLAGEEAIQQSSCDFIIVRPQWLFGPHGKNFVSTILTIAREKGTVSVVNDQYGSPTYSKDLAKAIRLLIEHDARGIFHVCNRGKASWYELAKRAIEVAELDADVIPVSTREFPRPAARPKNSILSTKKFTETTGKLMPPWQISLQNYIKEYLFEYRRSEHA